MNQAADTPVDAGGLAEIEAAPTVPTGGGVKFGWIKGVLVSWTDWSHLFAHLMERIFM